MHNILILGAGKSSGSLIDYLAEHARGQEWSVTVADVSENPALQKTKGARIYIRCHANHAQAGRFEN